MAFINNASRLTAFDVLVVGGGAAGLYAALSIPDQWRVGLITKDNLSLSASDWAQGGIAAALGPDDSLLLHRQDTLRAGAGLCEPAAVDHLVREAANCIHHLLDLGVAFDRNHDQLAMTLEAAHCRRRVLHAADTTGRAIVSILAEAVLKRPNIQVYENAFVLDLWLDRQRCRGLLMACDRHLQWLSAQATVLATGGGGQVYAHTTNPDASTGDGVAMAWRAGGELRDLEFFQFHPTALAQSGAPPFLISEAVRGEGAHLVDGAGYRFAQNYHPDGELAPRDVVSRAIFQHLQKTGDRQVWLDMRVIPEERLYHRFPNIIQVCRQWGCDPLTQLVPVAPAAHYWMGGITTDLHSQTTIPGLYAVGENASTGVHGANRLASNSLLECLVYGAELAHLSLPRPPLTEVEVPISPESWASDQPPVPMPDLHNIARQRQELTDLMWNNAGISRNQKGLDLAIATLANWRQEWADQPLASYLAHLRPGNSQPLPPELTIQQLRSWGELRNLYDTGWLVLTSAAFRTESRGGHFRDDYPQPDPHWQVHTLVISQEWKTSAAIAANPTPE
ncbi:MAG: L-aspartate oxidase [Nodosilinea sp.]